MTIAPERRKLEWIQVLRAVAVMMVVLFHLGTIEGKYGGGGSLLPAWVESGIAGVDLFFVISGFVMATLMRGAFANPRNALGFLARRAERIYPPYWFYTALVLAVWLLKPAWVNSSQGGRIDFVSSFLLLPMDGLPALMVGWSLVFEMFFYLVMAAFLAWLPERRFGWGLAGWAALTVIFSLSLRDRGGPWVQVAVNPMALEFIAGAALALIWHKGRGTVPFLIGLPALAAIPFAYTAYAPYASDSFAGWWMRIFLFLPCALILMMAALSRERKRRPAPRWLVVIGDASYSIYLSHVLVLSALGRVWTPFSGPGSWDNAIALPLLALATVGAGLASHRWLEVPVLGFFRRRRSGARVG